MEKKVPIFYFSGTGNTWWVGNTIAEALGEAGYDASTHSIEQVSPQEVGRLINQAEVVGIGYPIYGSDAPGIMKTFIDQLPAVDGPKPMLIYITQMEWSGNGAYFLRRKIEAKGYQIRWAVHFRMPNNIGMDIFPVPATADYEKFSKRLEKAEAMAAKLAQRIRGNQAWIHSNNPFAWLAAWFQRGPFRIGIQWTQNRTYSVDAEKCTHCGRCERICPVDNITLNQAGLPEWSDHCILCVRCFNYCPEQAILAYQRPFNHKRFGEKPFQGPVPEFKPELITKKQSQKT